MKKHLIGLYAMVVSLTLAGGTIVWDHVARADPLPDFLGHPLQATPIGDGSTFEVRHNCRIARFGVAPWLPKGQPKDAQWERMTRLWLGSINMPREGHDGAIAALRGARTGLVDVGNTTGAFDTTYRVGQRYVSCLGSATRFGSDDQLEPADLHRYRHAGRVWDLAIIHRCGNVTLLPAVPVVPPVAVLVPPINPGRLPVPPTASGPNGTWIAPPAATGPGGTWITPPGPPPVVHEVPEPPGLALMALAAAGLFFNGRKK